MKNLIKHDLIIKTLLAVVFSVLVVPLVTHAQNPGVGLLNSETTDVVNIEIQQGTQSTDSKSDKCKNKEKQELLIKQGWDDVRNSKGIVHWVSNLLLMPGRIIIWLLKYSYAC